MQETVSVIIPNYNGIEYYRDCLASLRKQSRKADRIIVVDNGSTDGSAEAIAQEFPEVEMIRFPRNTGFCGAVNAGIRASIEETYVILLNNDTIVREGFISGLVRAISGRPDVFSVQAKMLQMKDPSLMDDAGDLYCSLGWAFARGKGAEASRYTREEEIFSACAGAAIYRTEVFCKIGLFDEHHFAYLEDTDIGFRARIHGYRNLFTPDAEVLHVGSATSGSVYNHFKVQNTSRNSIYLVYKNMPPLMILINLPLLIPGFCVKAAFFALRGFGGVYVRGIREGFRMCGTGEAEGRRVRFKLRNLFSYIRIQKDLWLNTARRFCRSL